VEENFLVHEEIRNVSSLMADMFRDAVSTEIQAATKTSRQLRTVLAVTTALEAALIVFALVFIKSSQRTLSSAVADPIKELQAFAGRIADGHLSERTPEPDVDELRALSNSLNTMAGRLAGLMEENRLEQESLKKSELRVLQAQVTPHFLYNTLDAIVWLAEAKKTEEVISITRALSDFYRISLSDGHDWITLAQEEEHLRGYLTIQKIRYRDILDYEIDIQPGLRTEMILKLSIQPLVENAIYHGIRNRRGGGLITVRVWKEQGQLHVCVSDNGAGMSRERLLELRQMMAGRHEGDLSGFGLFNVDQRIKLYYAQAQGLHIESEQGQGSSISFHVPVMEKETPHV
jgi:two-component system sensor histidine kinase YesM